MCVYVGVCASACASLKSRMCPLFKKDSGGEKSRTEAESVGLGILQCPRVLNEEKGKEELKKRVVE